MDTRRLPKGLALCAVLAVIAGSLAVPARASEPRMASPHPRLVCQDCHVCAGPTAREPCLRPYPRLRPGQDASAELNSAQGPGSIRLDVLEHLYDPVSFDHRVHAEMAEMTRGCEACHHFTPTGASHPPCRECHATTSNDDGRGKLGLKGAYHRQCLDCHREWGGKDDCEVCHLPKASTEKREPGYAAAILRPAREPAARSYETGSKAGPFVTFFHKNHAQHYGLSCSECHRADPCVACHYQGAKPLAEVRAAADAMHHKCAACHDIQSEAGCGKCHTGQPRTAFSHAVATGFELSPYHGVLTCASCHPAGKRISRPESACNDCHGSWDSETFQHAVVGLKLSEDHADLDCEDCHADRRFEQPPTCVDCHDEKAYPRDKPGEPVKRRPAKPR